MGFFSQLALKLAPQLGMLILTTVLGLSALGWYHFNVTRPAKKVDNYENVVIPEKDKKIGELEKNIKDKDSAITALKESSENANKLCTSVSSQCKSLFAERKKDAEKVANTAGTVVEGHGPAAMNSWYRKHYAEE